MRPNRNPLSTDFLYELYNCALQCDNVCSALVKYMDKQFLPDKAFQAIQESIARYYRAYNTSPTFAILMQSCNNDPDALELCNEIKSSKYTGNPDALLDLFGEYIKSVKLQLVYLEVGKLYNSSKHEEAQKALAAYATWLNGFTLKSSPFIDIAQTFKERFEQNRLKKDDPASKKLKPVTRFYIDILDQQNNGRNLRTQLSVFMAPTGVGKSHMARHIGNRACIDDGLDVLHFQLEGTEKEVADAYSGAFISRNSFLYENGALSDAEMQKMYEQVSSYAGSVTIRSFPRFKANISTIDISDGIAEYKKETGKKPDIVIIDSMDLLTDSSGKTWNADHERQKRISVANDLKDIAGDENVWMVATYQSTIENREWLNDEKNVLTEYNASEAKGISRPMTHLITLNQSDAEREENIMRIHIAKARFFKKIPPFKIATDYDNEIFYDHKRSMMQEVKSNS